MEFLGLSLITWQTLLIIGFPLIYGSFSRLKGLPKQIRHPFKKSTVAISEDPGNGSTSNSNSTQVKKKKIQLQDLLRIRTLILSLMLLTHFSYYIIHRPSKSNIFKLTKLPINVPSTTLATSLTRYYKSKGLEDTPFEQDRLVKKLNTLDARLLYSTLGSDPFLHCIWCRPPSSKYSSSGLDHLIFTISRLLLIYSILFISIGLLTTGANHPNLKRKFWRPRISLFGFFYMAFELSTLAIQVFLPSFINLSSDVADTMMIWDGLFNLRFLVMTTLIILAWYSVITETPKDPISGIPKLGFSIAALGAELDALVNRLRLTALQRSALMRDGNCRNQINEFWKNAECQAKEANEDERVTGLKDQMGLSSKNSEHRDQLKNWIDLVYPDASLNSSPNSPTTISPPPTSTTNQSFNSPSKPKPNPNPA